MEIILKKLKIENFKGIKDLSIEFSANTSIYGANATGKTTIFDAFTWLLFNKDSQGNTAFEIKTLDKNNKVINRLEHLVEGILCLNDKYITLKKIHKQKWVKKKGAAEETLEGSENQFYWNEVPVKEKDYQQKICEIIDPGVFALITSPNKFNGLGWKDRREILFQLAGGIEAKEIILSNSRLTPLLEVLEDKTPDEYKREIAAKKTKLKKNLEAISPRIDEVHKNILPVPDQENIETLTNTLEIIEAALYDNQKAYNDYQLSQREKYSEIDDLELQIQQTQSQNLKAKKQAEYDKSTKIQNIQYQIKAISDNIKKLQDDNKYIANLQESENSRLLQLRQQSRAKKLEVFSFDETLCICPTCKRAFEGIDIEVKRAELENNFNKEKAIMLELIKEQGIKTKAVIEKSENDINANKEEISRFRENLEAYKNQLNAMENQPLEYDITPTAALETALGKAKSSITPYSDQQAESKKAQILQEKQLIQDKIKSSQKALTIIENNRRALERIAELEQTAKDTAELIAALEGEEFLLEEFSRDSIKYTEEKINALFTITKFKMFHQQVNGGVCETCEILHMGVPYSDLNTAARINVGLDIINALTAFYGVYAPIFIDNRESVTELIETASQIVNLIVSENHNQLSIERG